MDFENVSYDELGSNDKQGICIKQDSVKEKYAA